MKDQNSYLRIYLALFLLIYIANSVFALDDLLALQGNVQQSGVNLASGNLTVWIYDAITGGNLIYNSSTDFNNAISNGKYDVMLGNGTQTLSLEYGRIYYVEMYVNNEKFTFNGANRQILQSSTGQINGTFIGVRQINESHLSYNINLTNATGYLSANLVGTISISQISGIENFSMTNQSTTWDAGTNVSVGVGGWFKGAFNWVISALTPSSFATFNGTALWINTTYFYNQTVPTNSSQWIADGTTIRNRNSGIVNITNGLNVVGNTEFNGGWANNGVSIINGDVFAQTIYVLNITSLSVSNMNVNGSLIPGAGFNNTFDIGSSTWQWRNAYFQGVYVNNVLVNTTWQYNQTATALFYNQTQSPYFYNMSATQFFYNMSDTKYYYNQTQSPYFYNMSATKYYYNMSDTKYFYNQSLYADNFIKNGTYAWFRYLNVSGEIVTGGINISSPGNKLTIVGSTTAYKDYLQINDSSDPGVGAVGITMSNPQSDIFIRAYGSGAPSNLSNTTLIYSALGNGIKIGTSVLGANISLVTSNSFAVPQFTLTSAGYVGIGTVRPTQMLEVKAGNVNISTGGNMTIGGGKIWWDGTNGRLVIHVS